MDAMLVVGSPEQTETALVAGEIPYPDCSAPLRPHGHARTHTVRSVGQERLTVQPRRARCSGCRRTQVMFPASLSFRRADSVEVIGTALAAKAGGQGHRTIAAMLGRPVSTVRRWLRRVPETHVRWLHEQAVMHAFRLNPEMLAGLKQWPSLLGRSPNILAGAALANRQRVDPGMPLWISIGYFTRGNLLSPPLPT
ncbi:helix-turn-helix domain-containing protein [Arthrobacter sp. STN4]|uniref:helix-turn-helix domain-containing protein n=1 Tax=Arthrobacter sp. STN4 TaxID=2923276 RepID=UPI00211A0026|nr:helix-turn-helix domain-containing protein [Arthrobacter sp. STN4]MCQ9163984.1 helix-turn-helix domain-containing protein [Arthrobacter sp. STN4]